MSVAWVKSFSPLSTVVFRKKQPQPNLSSLVDQSNLLNIFVLGLLSESMCTCVDCACAWNPAGHQIDFPDDRNTFIWIRKVAPLLLLFHRESRLSLILTHYGLFARIHPQSSKILLLPNCSSSVLQNPPVFALMLKMRGSRILNPPKSSDSSCHFTGAVRRAGTLFLKGQGNFSFSKGTCLKKSVCLWGHFNGH